MPTEYRSKYYRRHQRTRDKRHLVPQASKSRPFASSICCCC